MGSAESATAVAEHGAGTFSSSKNVQYAMEIALLVSVFVVFVAFGLHGMTDSKFSMLVSEDLLRDHSFVFKDSVMPRKPASTPGYLSNGYPYQIEISRGAPLYFYPIGSSLLSLPFVALMNMVGISTRNPDGTYNEDGDRRIQAALAALLMAALTVVFFRTALLRLPLSWSIVLALGGAFSTQIWSTASRVLWSHTWALFLVGLAIYLLLAEEEQQLQGHPVVLATLLSWAYFVRPTTSIPVAAIATYLLLFRRKQFAALATTGALWMLAFVTLSWKVTGKLLPSYYLFHLTSQHSWEAIAGDLISPSRGLFVYVPASAFALLLLAYYWRELSHRRMAVLSIIIITVHLFVVSGDQNWWGGHCYGARLTTDVVPWLLLLAVLGCRGVLDERSATLKRSAMAIGLITIVIGALINGRGAVSSAANDWVNGPPDVDQQSDRVWDWSDPQFLSGLQILGHPRAK